VQGTNASAFGQGATARGENTTALGQGAEATHKNSAAIGQGVKTTRENQVAIGQATNTYTMSGIASAESRAAQGAPAYFVTSNAQGDLATHTAADLGLASAGDISHLNSQIGGLQRRDDELAEGIAVSLALAQPIFQPGQDFAMRFGWGNFEGSNALGLSLAGVVDRGGFGEGTSIVVDGGIGYGTSENTVAGKAGITFGW
jgi:hypothetical protein